MPTISMKYLPMYLPAPEDVNYFGPDFKTTISEGSLFGPRERSGMGWCGVVVHSSENVSDPQGEVGCSKILCNTAPTSTGIYVLQLPRD